MSMLTDPPAQKKDTRSVDWTPLSGLVRGATWGLVLAGVLALPLAALARWVPCFVIMMPLRMGLALGLTWLLVRIVERAAGMEDWRCTLLAVSLTTLVLVSNHLVFALHGVHEAGAGYSWYTFPMALLEKIVPSENGLLIGWEWLHPYALLATNAVPVFVGGVVCPAIARASDV